MRKLWIIGTIVVLLWLVAVYVGLVVFPTDRMAFRRYVYSPIPQTVQKLRFESIGSFTMAIYGCGHFGFSIAREELQPMIRGKGLARVEKDQMSIYSGVSWFKPDSISTNGEFFFRRGTNNWGPVEFLWVDETGTNCWFVYDLLD